MVTDSARRRTLKLVAALGLLLSLAACSTDAFVAQRTEGYVIPDSALQQIRPGQSVDLVVTVLGSPQTTNTFGENTAFYYVENKVERTAFGLRLPKERRVLAVYFDKDKRVESKVLYGLEDGKIVDINTHRTPSYGQDRTFVQSILASF
ncbi:MAG: outer membrane protein assembly factor BamE [Alphaproteobacteria bacterium]|nr:outer membrane protein assembly factor BamE [Alphaproteobacteria bacterium]